VSPLFKAPTPQPSTSPNLQETPPPPPPLPPVDEAAPWSTDAPSDPGPSAVDASNTPSTGSGFKLSKAGLKTGVGVGFRQVCKLLGAFIGNELERAHDVWTPDPDDVDDVARPATAIVYRRLPDDAKSNDVIDLIALGLALAGYFGKALSRRADLRAAVAGMEQQGVNVDEQEQGGIPRYPGGGF
jgi:hypothetical protein